MAAMGQPAIDRRYDAPYGAWSGEGAVIRCTVLQTTLGAVLVAATDRGVCSVRMGDDATDLEAALRAEFPSSQVQRVEPVTSPWATAISEYLAGNERRLGLPLDVDATPFERLVWEALRSIPYGETRSYAAVARAIGRPEAARAVAGACARNPVALVVPCHRVIRDGGALGGYRWGVHRKAALLERERTALLEEERVVLRDALAPALDRRADASARTHPQAAIGVGALVAGRYRIRRVLGAGGAGIVHLADDLVLDEPVALKSLRPEVAADAAAVARFTRELRLTRRISHPHVIRAHDIGEADGRPFITMEWIDGCSLRELLEAAPPSGRASVVIVRQLCRALETVHRLSVVHRDIKPENVLFTAEGRLVLTDFGIAELPASGSTESSVVSGTLPYMAPEQLLGETADARADVYAAGALLHECLTGVPPHDGRSAASVLARAHRGVSPSALERAGVGTALAVVIARALSFDPSDRFARASELHDALASAEDW